MALLTPSGIQLLEHLGERCKYGFVDTATLDTREGLAELQRERLVEMDYLHLGTKTRVAWRGVKDTLRVQVNVKLTIRGWRRLHAIQRGRERRRRAS